MQRISTGYFPRRIQEEMHVNKKRFNVIVCHRRFGKTVFAINDMIDTGLRCILKNPQLAYFSPYHGQSKRVAWEYFKDFTKMIPGVLYNEAELRINIPRPDRGDKITIYLLGADNPTAILGMYFDMVILDEYAEMDPIVWSRVLRPTLADRNGQAIFIGTPRGMNHFYDVLQIAKRNESGEWYYKEAKASETGLISASELKEARSTMTPEEYEQEFEISFTAALIGSYYGREMEAAEKEGRLINVAHEKNLPVETWWDLGISDTTAIWLIQQVGREYRAIDYIEDSGRGLDYYVKVLKERGYVYGEHFLPHDAAARELGTGKSRQETLRSLGLNEIRITPRQSIDDGINAVRMLLPKFWFDKVKCERGINALKNYERRYDSKNKIFSNAPLHNWASNGSDAFRTGAMATRDSYKKIDRQQLPRQTESDYDILG